MAMNPERPRLRLAALLLAVVIAAGACSSSSPGTQSSSAPTGEATTEPATDDEATIPDTEVDGALQITALPGSLAPLAGAFSKHIDVWGVNIVATAGTDDAKMTHAANVMAQYLDNDADGMPDNQAVVDAMVANNATLLMGQTPDEFESIDADAVFAFVGRGGQDLYASETLPDGVFDASLEEVHHLILNTGWAQVFPDQLAQARGSAVADAMDIARGGQFDSIPNPYPDGAWFTYDDSTCDYTCMITEYTYWAHTSLLGAQADRGDEIGDEWQLETTEKVRAGDPAVTAVLEDPALGLPTVLPDGHYQPISGAAPTNSSTDVGVSGLYEATGNPDADVVVITAQGGPSTELFSVAGEVAEVLNTLDLTQVQLVSVHQVQTLDPDQFTAQDLTFEQTQAATADTTAHLSAVVSHFDDQGKTVYVVGISYGAFVVQELLATQGNIADGYLIEVGRIDMPEQVWTVFSNGEAAGFVDGTEVVEFSIEEAGMGAGTPAGDRNMARLAASLGQHRYSERLADIDMSNVVYVYGTTDEQVGRLTADEVLFLTSRGADVIEYEGGHGTPDSVTADAVGRLIDASYLN